MVEERRMSEGLRKIVNTHVVEDQALYDPHGRREVVEVREGRPWYLVVDTPFGHARQQMEIVTGVVANYNDEDDDDDEEEEEEVKEEKKIDGAKLKEKLKFSASQMTRLMTLTTLMLGPSKKAKEKKSHVNMVQLMEEDDVVDPDLNIPMFAPYEGAPPPVVEITAEMAEAQLNARREHRQSAFVETTAARHGRGNKQPKEGEGGKGDDKKGNKKDKRSKQKNEELLEGFGAAEKTGVGVRTRKFVRRNRLLKKLFRRKSSGRLDPSQALVIDDDKNF